jgi:uncharacterized YccA/Bax inhibitor family protein
MRSSNPALGRNAFDQSFGMISGNETMTIQGVIFKTILCLLCLMLSAGWVWVKFYESGGNVAAVSPYMWGGVIGGLILAMITIFKKEWAPITAPSYALVEGLVIGGLSSMFEAAYPGIVIQAVSLTFGTLFVMLAVYATGLIKVTERFKLGVMAATGGIFLFYFLSIMLSFFGVTMPLVYSSTPFGIAFSLFVVAIAALNLVIDFDMIEQGSKRGAPKYMEWYASFALMVTLVWLYIEFLRLLSKLQSRN